MNVEVTCPVYSRNGNIDINEDEMNDIERGIMSISIAENFICIYSFLVYIDKNFKERDSLFYDFSIKLPDIQLVDPDSDQVKNQILKLYTLAQDLIEYNTTLNKNQDITTKMAIDFINKKYNKQISYQYASLLIDIIINYFEVDLKKPPSSADIIGFF